MSLESRIEYFRKFTKLYRRLTPITSLIAITRIGPRQWKRLEDAAKKYYCASSWRSITPNGMIVPKKETTLEYNLFAREFSSIIDSTKKKKFIDYWVLPPALRIKRGNESEDRPRASEHIHTEAWVPINTNQCITVFAPILGDWEHNKVEFFMPPKNFEESWLEPRESYVSGEEISKQYIKVNVPYQPRTLIFAETATMHRSVRSNNCGPRISFDLSFHYKDRNEPRSQNYLLDQIGKKLLYSFYDSAEDDIQEGHPAERYKLVVL